MSSDKDVREPEPLEGVHGAWMVILFPPFFRLILSAYFSHS